MFAVRALQLKFPVDRFDYVKLLPAAFRAFGTRRTNFAAVPTVARVNGRAFFGATVVLTAERRRRKNREVFTVCRLSDIRNGLFD